MIKKELINVILSAILIFAIGLVSGFSLGYFRSAQTAFPKMTEVADLNPGIATIRFLKFENGLLKGEIAGQKSRLAYSPEGVLDLKPGQSFEIPAAGITLYQYYSVRDLPEGTQFIASKSGKYYYSVLNPKAFGITPKNRLHFKTEEEAEKMGYLAPK
ncbi:hypothetical protein KJ657_03210 [Patescibacteria group bacterium]|nr:hypothetical protein [Patescibacteria group bacterium]MBU1016073.1 hypothetical protein [Patescibacteria group bacterium]MBU1684909.1 hypothetical protein [Patescibacteria group bacterium]